MRRWNELEWLRARSAHPPNTHGVLTFLSHSVTTMGIWCTDGKVRPPHFTGNTSIVVKVFSPIMHTTIDPPQLFFVCLTQLSSAGRAWTTLPGWTCVSSSLISPGKEMVSRKGAQKGNWHPCKAIGFFSRHYTFDLNTTSKAQQFFFF